jgi:hypothetical protein
MVNSISYESKVKESKDLVIKQTTITVLRKPVIFVVMSLFALALIWSSYSTPDYVFAKPKATRGNVHCYNFGDVTVKCCQAEYNDRGQETHIWCTLCDKTDPPSNCGPRWDDRARAGLAPPPSTKTCPDGSAPDANGNCPPVTQGPRESPPSTGVDCTANPNDPSCATKITPSVDCNKNPDDPLCKPVGINPPPRDQQGTTHSPTDDNKPSKPKLPKGDILVPQPDQGVK